MRRGEGAAAPRARRLRMRTLNLQSTMETRPPGGIEWLVSPSPTQIARFPPKFLCVFPYFLPAAPHLPISPRFSGGFSIFFSPLPHFSPFLSHFLNVSPLLPICCHVSISIPFYTPEMDKSTQEPKITIENPPKFSKTYRNCPKLAPKFLNLPQNFQREPLITEY